MISRQTPAKHKPVSSSRDDAFRWLWHHHPARVKGYGVKTLATLDPRRQGDENLVERRLFRLM